MAVEKTEGNTLMTKPSIIACCFVLSLIAFNATLLCRARSPKEVISLEKSEIIFQELRVGLTASETIRIHNVGPRDLRITGVQASCGCLDPEVSSSFLQSESSISLKTSIKGAAGMITGVVGTVNVTFDNGAMLGIPIKVRNIKGLSIVPMLVYFGHISKSELPKSLRVYLLGVEGGEIGCDVSHPEFVSVLADDNVEDVPEHHFTITLTENTPAGRLLGSVTFVNESFSDEMASVSVIATINDRGE